MHDDNDRQKRSLEAREEPNPPLFDPNIGYLYPKLFLKCIFRKKGSKYSMVSTRKTQIIPEHLLDDLKVELKQIYFGYS